MHATMRLEMSWPISTVTSTCVLISRNFPKKKARFCDPMYWYMDLLMNHLRWMSLRSSVNIADVQPGKIANKMETTKFKSVKSSVNAVFGTLPGDDPDVGWQGSACSAETYHVVGEHSRLHKTQSSIVVLGKNGVGT